MLHHKLSKTEHLNTHGVYLVMNLNSGTEIFMGRVCAILQVNGDI